MKTASEAIAAKSLESIPPSKKYKLRPAHRWWWWEIGAAVLSLTCLTLIFVTLMSMHGKPLSSWKLKISINTTVSVLATVAKSALMLLVAEALGQLKWLYFDTPRRLSDLQVFDDATRGPFGATTFLWHIRGRAYLGSVGCLITIIGLGFEPAAQQMLSFSTKSVVSHDANVAASLGYATGFIPTNLVDAGGASTDAPADLQNRVISSIAGTVLDGLQQCTTSSCQFKDFSSLGVCGTCRNITDQTKKTGGVTGYKSEQYTFTPNDTFYGTINVSISAGNGLDLNTNNEFAISTVVPGTAADANTEDRRLGLLVYNMTMPYGFADSVGTLDDIHACDFRWCHRSYRDVSITNDKMVYTDGPSVLLDVNPADDYDTTLNLKLNSSVSGVPDYIIDKSSDEVLFNYLQRVLAGHANADTLIQILSQQDLNASTNNVALAVTNYMRQAGNNASGDLGGDVMDQVTFVHVNWGWLIWPLNLTIMGAGFLFVTIIQSERRPDLLKSSALALLFHGLKGFDEQEVTGTWREDGPQLESKAREMRTTFARDEDGVLKFVKS